MQNNMYNSLRKNGFGAKVRSPTYEYEEKLKYFHGFFFNVQIAHLSDVTETREIINVVKLLDFCNWHFQFYVLSRFLYNKFFSNCKNWRQKLDLIEYGFLSAVGHCHR